MKKNIILWLGMIAFLSACVYYSFPKNQEEESQDPETQEEEASVFEYDEIIEAYFKNRPVRDVPQGADFASFLTGTFAQKNKDFEKLATSYEKVLKTDLENKDIKESLYLYFVLSGQVDKALPYAYQAQDIKQSDILSQMVILSGLVKKAQYDEALEVVGNLNGAYSHFMIPLLKTWLYVAKNDEVAALNVLNTLQNQPALSSAYLLHKGMVLDYFNRPLEAAVAYNELLKSKEAQNVRVLLLLKDFELRTHALADKKTFSQNYINLEEESFISKEMMSRSRDGERVKSASEGVSWVLFDMGNAFGQLNNFELALCFSNLALYLNPDSSIVQLFTGEILEAMDMYSQANALYEKVKPEQNIYLSAQMRTVLNQIKVGDLKQAETALKSLIRKYPDIPLFYMTLADTYRQNEKYEPALKNYQKALDLVKRRDKQVAPIYFYQGVCYEALGKLDLALPLLEKALALDEDNPVYLNYVGYAWLEQKKNLPEALKLIQKAVSFAPDDGNILDSLGLAYFLLEDYDNALINLEKATTLEAGNAIINSHLGDVYWRLKRYREAKFQWSHAYTLKQSSSPKLLSELSDKMKNGLKD